MMPYQKLLAWKACHELAVEVYKATNYWPRTERYGLAAQVRKAAYSASARIAEGPAKPGRAEFRRYLDISNGSSELSSALELARDLRMVDSLEYGRLESLRANAGRLTWLLYRSLRDGQGGKDRQDGRSNKVLTQDRRGSVKTLRLVLFWGRGLGHLSVLPVLSLLSFVHLSTLSTLSVLSVLSHLPVPTHSPIYAAREGGESVFAPRE